LILNSIKRYDFKAIRVDKLILAEMVSIADLDKTFLVAATPHFGGLSVATTFCFFKKCYPIKLRRTEVNIQLNTRTGSQIIQGDKYECCRSHDTEYKLIPIIFDKIFLPPKLCHMSKSEIRLSLNAAIGV
jgi:hypothetical protein